MGYAMNAAQGGRVSLPVSQSAYIYSHLRHVSGTPAPDGVQGVSINTLRVIDVLLEQLQQLEQVTRVEREMPQTEVSFADTAASASAELSVPAETGARAEMYVDNETLVNGLAEQYAQLRANMEATNAALYAPASPFPGMLFDIGV